MHTSLNILGLVLLMTALTLGGCSSSVFHKDGLKEAVTDPLVEVIDDKADKLIEQVDDLELNELVESSKDLVEQTEKSMAKLTELVEEVKNTAEVSTQTLEQITKTLESITALVGKLEGTAASSTALIKTANELLTETKTLIPELRKVAENTNEILPEIKNLIANLNATVGEVKGEIKSGTTDSIWLKILPALAILLGVLIGVFFVVRAIKK